MEYNTLDAIRMYNNLTPDQKHLMQQILALFQALQTISSDTEAKDCPSASQTE